MSTRQPVKKPAPGAARSAAKAGPAAAVVAPPKPTPKPAVKPAQTAAKQVPAKKPAPARKLHAAKAPASTIKAAQPAAPVEAKKPSRRLRLVRDSFTMPESDIALIGQLKAVALSAQRAAKKSELLRAGLHALAGLDAAALVAALDALEAVKTGRPKKA